MQNRHAHREVSAHKDAPLADAVPIFIHHRAGAAVPPVLPRTAHLYTKGHRWYCTPKVNGTASVQDANLICAEKANPQQDQIAATQPRATVLTSQ